MDVFAFLHALDSSNCLQEFKNNQKHGWCMVQMIHIVSFSRWNDGTFDVNPVSLGSWLKSLLQSNFVGILSRFQGDSRCWFQRLLIFIPTWGNDPISLIFFKWVETAESRPLMRKNGELYFPPTSNTFNTILRFNRILH